MSHTSRSGGENSLMSSASREELRQVWENNLSQVIGVILAPALKLGAWSLKDVGIYLAGWV